MPQVPLSIRGVTRQVWVESLTEDTWEKEQHQYRREGVILRRLYYRKEQYDGENLEKKLEVFSGLSTQDAISKPLPEHQRKHQYATQVADGIDFIADQIAGAMRVESPEEKVQLWLEAQFSKSRMKHRWQEIIREVEIAGDVFCRVVPKRNFEGEDPACRIEYWQAEDVEADYSEDDWTLLEEIRWEKYRTEVNANGDKEEVRYVHRVNLQPFVLPGEAEMKMEAVESVYRGDLDKPISVRRLGLPFIPWTHISGEKMELRSMWGKPVISSNLMETVDRYNAVNQLEFIAARYNAFSHVAVVGDAAMMKLDNQGAVIDSDIADILVFPSGTGVEPITLPTDTDLLDAQKKTLKAAMFECMGLVEIDADSLEGKGQMSGYALEIVNRKTDGTFKALVENVDEGIKATIEMGLLVDAYVRGSTLVPASDEPIADVVWNWWTVDPDRVWPKRQIELRFGSAYIVDEVANRDDFIAKLISRPEALRNKGLTDKQIEKIEKEIADAQGAEEQQLSAALTMGSRLSTERG